METLIRPSDPELSISISSGQNINTITIPCFLHTKDCDGLYDHIFTYLKKCSKTEEFINQINAELEEYAPFKSLFESIDSNLEAANKRLDSRINHFAKTLKYQDMYLRFSKGYRSSFWDAVLKSLE